MRKSPSPLNAVSIVAISLYFSTYYWVQVCMVCLTTSWHQFFFVRNKYLLNESMIIKQKWEIAPLDLTYLFNFLLVRCEFHIIHPVPLISPPFRPHFCLQMFISVSWFCSRPLASATLSILLLYQYWLLTGTPLRHPVVALCCGDPAALDVQDPQFADGVDTGWVASVLSLHTAWVPVIKLRAVCYPLSHLSDPIL